jgi:hypothetical protein
LQHLMPLLNNFNSIVPPWSNAMSEWNISTSAKSYSLWFLKSIPSLQTDGRQQKAAIPSQYDLGHCFPQAPCQRYPKSDDQLAGYTLLLLLASPSSLVIAKYAGLDDTTGQQDLFDIALMVQPACPVPNTADVARTPGSSEAQSAQKEPTLPRNPPVTGNPSATQNCHSSKQPATASDDTTNKSTNGDYTNN